MCRSWWVLDVTFLFQVLYVVLVVLKLWSLGEYFFQVFAVRQWWVVKWRLLSFGSVLLLKHFGGLELVDVLFNRVHLFENQRDFFPWILSTIWTILSLLISYIWVIVDGRMTVQSETSDINYGDFGHFNGGFLSVG